MSSAIHTIDLQYLGIPKAVAAFVIFDRARGIGPVLVETGPASTLSALAHGIERLHLDLRDVRHALVTHIHLDHAGAAGTLAAHGAAIHVHEFGAGHLIDPTKLVASAERIYGNQMERLWGTVTPVPEQQVRAVHDGDVIVAEGVELTAIESPGHARHHHAFAVRIDGERLCFTGDVAGFNATAVSPTYVSVPTPPPEFDLEAWLASIDRLQAEEFDALYLTHFGRVDGVDRHWNTLRDVLHSHAQFVRQRIESGVPRDTMIHEYVEWNRLDARAHGIGDADFSRYVSRNLLTMNVDGMRRYWSRLLGIDQT